MAKSPRIVRLDRKTARRKGIILDVPHIAYAGKERNRVVGIGGLCWREGLCWLWLDAVDTTRPHAVTVFRMARRMISKARTLGEIQLFAPRDTEAPRSQKLLEMLGFVRLPDDARFGGHEIWRLTLNSDLG